MLVKGRHFIKAILDGNYNTYWATKGKDTSAVIELHLKDKYTFNVLMLQEDINVGQGLKNLF